MDAIIEFPAQLNIWEIFGTVKMHFKKKIFDYLVILFHSFQKTKTKERKTKIANKNLHSI